MTVLRTRSKCIVKSWKWVSAHKVAKLIGNVEKTSSNVYNREIPPNRATLTLTTLVNLCRLTRKINCFGQWDLLLGLAPTMRKWGQSVNPRSKPRPKLSKVHWAERPLPFPITHLSNTFLPVTIVTFSGSSIKNGLPDTNWPEVKYDPARA